MNKNSELEIQKIWPIENKKDHYLSTVFIPDSLLYFRGHFPNNPILPAVAIIDLCQSLLESLLKQDIVIKEIKKTKFSVPILPNDQLKIEFNIDSDFWKFTIYKGNDRVSVLQFSTFAAE